MSIQPFVCTDVTQYPRIAQIQPRYLSSIDIFEEWSILLEGFIRYLNSTV